MTPDSGRPELDCLAARGNAAAARLARGLDRHPLGPPTAEDAVEAIALGRA